MRGTSAFDREGTKVMLGRGIPVRKSIPTMSDRQKGVFVHLGMFEECYRC